MSLGCILKDLSLEDEIFLHCLKENLVLARQLWEIGVSKDRKYTALGVSATLVLTQNLIDGISKELEKFASSELYFENLEKGDHYEN